jgi:hypothetical protein
MHFKKRMFNKKPRRIKRDAGGRNKRSITYNGVQREYINKWDKEQQEWARTFNHYDSTRNI